MTVFEKVDLIGSHGIAGWVTSPENLDEDFERMARAWNFWTRLWYWFRPPLTKHRIAYEHDERLWVLTPTHQMMALLKRGDVIRHMRQIDSFGPNGIPVFEGSGELLPPMTEQEAIEFIAWKDIPRSINHRAILTVDDIPKTRARRNSWRLTESGIVEA